MMKYLCVPAIPQVRVTVCHGVSKSNTVPVPMLPVTRSLRVLLYPWRTLNIELAKYHKLVQKINKFFGCHGTFNDVMCDDAVKCNNGENWKPLSLHKTFPLDTWRASQRPAPASVRHSLIFACLITKHEHIWIRDKFCNAVHVYCMIMFIAFKGLAWNILICEM